MARMCKPEYLTKVSKLSKIETERLLSRMTGKLPRRLEKEKITTEEALAIQLEVEDEQLLEWRKVMRELRAKEKAKAAKKQGNLSNTKSKTIAPAKSRVAIEDIAPAKPKTGKKKTAQDD